MTTFTVTTLSDFGPGSLRAAVAAAQNGDAIVFSTALAGGTITLGSTLQINASISIDGAIGALNINVSGGNAVTVFSVANGAVVSLLNMGILNGLGTGVAGQPSPAGDAAGGVFVASGVVTLTNDSFVGNAAASGSGAASAAGAVFVEPGASVISSGLTFLNNLANIVGPGLGGVAYPISNVASVAACFGADTLILTDRGERPIERLAIGDRVITAGGGVEPIKWIGRRSYAGRFLSGNLTALPVVIRAGALGAGLPHRDLRVSPNHAMHIDGLLVPAAVLVNGATIVQETACRRVDYIHLELAQHDILLAEGAASESFLDDDSRGLFHNAAEFDALYPDAAPAGGFCAPRAVDGFEVAAIRQRLGAIAAARQAA